MCVGGINGSIKTNIVWNNDYQIRYGWETIKNTKVFCIEIMFQVFLEFSLCPMKTKTEITEVALLIWLIKDDGIDELTYASSPKCHNYTSKDWQIKMHLHSKLN